LKGDDEIEAKYIVYQVNMELQIKNELWDEWVSLKGSLLADLHQERAMSHYTKTLQDGKGQYVHGAAVRKEMEAASKARTVEVKTLEIEKKGIGA
jgi:hypothetical protein